MIETEIPLTQTPYGAARGVVMQTLIPNLLNLIRFALYWLKARSGLVNEVLESNGISVTVNGEWPSMVSIHTARLPIWYEFAEPNGLYDSSLNPGATVGHVRSNSCGFQVRFTPPGSASRWEARGTLEVPGDGSIHWHSLSRLMPAPALKPVKATVLRGTAKEVTILSVVSEVLRLPVQQILRSMPLNGPALLEVKRRLEQNSDLQCYFDGTRIESVGDLFTCCDLVALAA